jgi:hypothetical protein
VNKIRKLDIAEAEGSDELLSSFLNFLEIHKEKSE